jgi:UDP-GlcNAc:undecaprenyl-phosphate GlcNAc-1-phosphate transferase
MAIALPVSAFVTSAVLTAVVRHVSLRRGFVARPAADRYHRTVVPLGGGLAIFWTIVLFAAGGLVLMKFVIGPGAWGWFDESVTVHAEGFLRMAPHLLLVLGCGAVLHGLGLWDDRKRLGPYLKLAVQFAVAIAVARFADIRMEFFIPNKIVTTAASAVWIVLIVNMFNFLDNMDGLSAGIALICTAVLFTAAALSGQLFVGALGLVFMGSLAGFLFFNFPPARIFMGDCGSLVVGYFLAIITLRTTYYHEAHGAGLYAVGMPLIVMAVPLYDFMSVTFLRLRQGKSPFVGDTQHFSHRLKRRGLTDTQVALTLYLATVCTGVSAVFLYQVDLAGALLILAQTAMILVMIAILESTSQRSSDGNRKATGDTQDTELIKPRIDTNGHEL